jgi:predicted nuclease of predicted toxin-antitoxin system
MLAKHAGLSGADDPDILAWAAADDRVVLTHDVATMIAFAYARVNCGQKIPAFAL